MLAVLVGLGGCTGPGPEPLPHDLALDNPSFEQPVVEAGTNQSLPSGDPSLGRWRVVRGVTIGGLPQQNPVYGTEIPPAPGGGSQVIALVPDLSISAFHNWQPGEVCHALDRGDGLVAGATYRLHLQVYRGLGISASPRLGVRWNGTEVGRIEFESAAGDPWESFTVSIRSTTASAELCLVNAERWEDVDWYGIPVVDTIRLCGSSCADLRT
jgi:hypothetical protein